MRSRCSVLHLLGRARIARRRSLLGRCVGWCHPAGWSNTGYLPHAKHTLYAGSPPCFSLVRMFASGHGVSNVISFLIVAIRFRVLCRHAVRLHGVVGLLHSSLERAPPPLRMLLIGGSPDHLCSLRYIEELSGQLADKRDLRIQQTTGRLIRGVSGPNMDFEMPGLWTHTSTGTP